MSGLEEKQEKKLKYPKSVFFIVSNECCERFSYHGMRVILALYFRNKLGFDDDMSTVIYHSFTMLVAFFPLIGAMIADAWLGKFKTILYLSIVYALGQFLLSATSVPIFNLPIRELSLVGLLLIAIGSGGIKPCVAAFGGEQFILPQQEKHLITFFSVLYFTINFGSLFSALLTPELRNSVKCFGDTTCDAAAFLMPAILMTLSIVIFIVGKRLYKIKEPEGNLMLDVGKCVFHAIRNKLVMKNMKREHWLDYADNKFDMKLIADLKSSLQIVKLFIPLPIFWALYEQQGSRWTFQATRMDGDVGFYFIKPDQMQVIDPFLILIFIPLFEVYIYPLMAKIHFINTPLKKLVSGGILAGVAFIVAAFVELQLEKTYPILPSTGVAQLRIFNPRNCSFTVGMNNQEYEIDSFAMWADMNIPIIGGKSIDYTADFTKCGEAKKSGTFIVTEGVAMSYVLGNTVHSYPDDVRKTPRGNPALRILTYNLLKESQTKVDLIQKPKSALNLETTKSELNPIQISNLIQPSRGIYDVEVNGKNVGSISIKLGGVYTLQIYTSEENTQIHLVTVTEPNSMHMLWLVPQYIIIAMAEVLFAVTGLEFAFTQAPSSMKSLLQAAWLLTIAVGNMIIIIIAKTKIFHSQANEFFLFAGLMFVGMAIFGTMAFFYKYIQLTDDTKKPVVKNEVARNDTGGQANPAFTIKNDEIDLI